MARFFDAAGGVVKMARTVVVGVAARKRSRWWAAALASYLIGIEATFPDNLAVVLQAGAGFIAAWARLLR